MARARDASGFQSSAGLVRTMDVDERRNIKIHPLVAILVPLALLALVIAVASLLGGR